MRNPWENPWKSIQEIHEKSMRNPWEIHENPYKKSMEKIHTRNAWENAW
jgi:hypothetical protein